MQTEIKATEDNKTWEFTELPQGHKAIGLKWVFKLKRDGEGNVTKHKARFVAKGYVQQQGIDYERREGDEVLVVAVYVDDLLITRTNIGNIHKFKKEMSSAFDMNDLEKLSYYLGMEVV
ncbi:putative mitochondrial protein AtMg00820 [Apium graveolens]|uniref:putative mitochondrial protein AtMg00820 n=1 Tax=Apium graveolens TaxID=4045 RepID=UPI003D7ADA70